MSSTIGFAGFTAIFDEASNDDAGAADGGHVIDDVADNITIRRYTQ